MLSFQSIYKLMRTFLEFIDSREREAIKHLKVMKALFESQGFNVKSFLTEDDPHLFIYNTLKDSTFEGVRLYVIAGSLAFRVQNESTTEPYGNAYEINIEQMFEDLLKDHRNSELAVKHLISSVTSEMKNFFYKSHKAEEDFLAADNGMSSDPGNRIIDRVGVPGGNAFGDMVYLPK